MKSMTGYGQSDTGSFEDLPEGIQFSIEIKSVNSRFRDINFRMPHSFNVLESKLRNTIQEKVNRGKLDVFINFSTSGLDNKVVSYDEDLAKEYVKILNKMMNINPMIVDSINLDLLATLPNIIEIGEKDLDENVLWEIIEPVVKEAVDKLIISREIEGNRLKEDLILHRNKAGEITEKIKFQAPLAFEEALGKLRERISESLAEVPFDEARFLNEVAYLADRLAIDEEIARLESHFESFDQIIQEEEPVGRKLDFLLQEFNREANTIGSKTSNIDIINNVVELKSELEKIREQVQNIE